MAKLLKALAAVVGIVIAVLIIWGLSELIYTIFNIEDEGTKTIIRWGVIVGFFITGALLRKKFPSLD